MSQLIFLLILSFSQILATQPNSKILHPSPKSLKSENEENSPEFWNNNALKTLKEHLARRNNQNVAKNIILFLGDGMSLPTLTATRVYLGNENIQLAFEKFPNTALSKTYCIDYQVADSACSATAYLGGVKGNMGTIGVNGHVSYANCQAMTNSSNHVTSIAQWAQRKGKSSGFVTTSRVTDASPAGVYGHTAKRDWEADTDIINSGEDPNLCSDLAKQLITGEVGKNLNVIMGGGRNAFLPLGVTDDEGGEGYRSDSVNLIDTWRNLKQDKKAQYIWNRTQLLNLDDPEYLLGLFESDHCRYNLERDQELDPTLSEMTEAAIRILSKNPEGYFLFVEGARIDMAHHGAMAHLALDETAEFAKAVQKAVDLTSEEDTLIVVTSDHSHTMSLTGYPLRGNDILNIAGSAGDGLPYTTLNYADGPGYRPPNQDGSRYDISKDDLSDVEYQFPGSFPTESESHGGDDVVIFARGPWSHLFSGVIEQNVIPHVMAYAACIGEGEMSACGEKRKPLIPLPYFF